MPNESAPEKTAVNNGIHGPSVEDICQDTTLTHLVDDEMQARGRKGGLGGIELIQGVVLSREEWTPDNGLVTYSRKLNRKHIAEKYKSQINIA